jgi:hypothetical protein
MFAGVINQAKSAASGLVLKYLARASVAVPFLIALGFALAATTVMLVERFGQVTAYWYVAGGLALVGVLAAVAVSIKEHGEEVAEKVAEKTDTEEVVSDATAAAMAQAPLALLGALFTMPGGPGVALSGVRLVARNLPLVVMLVALSALFWPTTRGADESEPTDDRPRPNGTDPHDMPSALRH